MAAQMSSSTASRRSPLVAAPLARQTGRLALLPPTVSVTVASQALAAVMTLSSSISCAGMLKPQGAAIQSRAISAGLSLQAVVLVRGSNSSRPCTSKVSAGRPPWKRGSSRSSVSTT